MIRKANPPGNIHVTEVIKQFQLGAKLDWVPNISMLSGSSALLPTHGSRPCEPSNDCFDRRASSTWPSNNQCISSSSKRGRPAHHLAVAAPLPHQPRPRNSSSSSRVTSSPLGRDCRRWVPRTTWAATGAWPHPL